MAEILAVVVSYKNWQITTRALRALEAQVGTSINVVCWDNASPDGSAGRLAATDFADNVQMVYSTKNYLWSPAINRAVEQNLTDEKYICMLNNDMVLPPNTLAWLVKVFETYPDAGLVGPLATMLGGPQDPLACRELQRSRGYLGDINAVPPYRVPFLIGACAMVRRTVWDEVGPLDELMPLGADDHDYAIRVKHAGHTIWVHPGVCGDHVGHATGDSHEWEDWGGRSWDRFNTKWADYYETEEQAIEAHWGGVFNPAFQVGTGWTEEHWKEQMAS